MYTARPSKSMLTEQQRNQRRKRASPHQTAYMEKVFVGNPKPDQSAREAIGRHIDMTPRSVQIWFQNRRAKKKKKEKETYRPSQNLKMRVMHPNLPPNRFTGYHDNPLPLERAFQGPYNPVSPYDGLDPAVPLPAGRQYNCTDHQYLDDRVKRLSPVFRNSIPYQSRGDIRLSQSNLYASRGNAMYKPETSYHSNDTASILNYGTNMTLSAYSVPPNFTTAALDRLMLGDPESDSSSELPESGGINAQSTSALPANEILRETDDSKIFASNFEEPDNDLNIDDFLKTEETGTFNQLPANLSRSEFSIF